MAEKEAEAKKQRELTEQAAGGELSTEAEASLRSEKRGERKKRERQEEALEMQIERKMRQLRARVTFSIDAAPVAEEGEQGFAEVVRWWWALQIVRGAWVLLLAIPA